MQFSFADYMYCYKIVKFGYSNSLLYWLCWKNIWLEPLVENELLIAEQSFISRQSLSSCLLYTLDFGFAFIEGDLHLIIYIRLFSHTLKGWKRNNSWQDFDQIFSRQCPAWTALFKNILFYILKKSTYHSTKGLIWKLNLFHANKTWHEPLIMLSKEVGDKLPTC